MIRRNNTESLVDATDAATTSSRLLGLFATRSVSRNDVPINEVVIRQWELNENSTRYDRLVAAPEDAALIKFWAGWSSIMLCTAILTTIIWIPLVLSKRVKKNPFNLYLIYLIIPDMLVAWLCGFTCLSNALAGHFTSVGMCQFQSFYMICSISANSWLNCVVAAQLYKMLSCAHKFRRYTPPTHKQVTLQALGVYAYSCFLGLWAIVDIPWWPHKTRLTIGAACLPMDYSTGSTIFFYCVFIPAFFGIPFGYVCWTGFQIYRRRMLPPTGRRRVLAIYFFRLAAVFLIMWLPGLLLLFVTGAWLDPWVEWVGGSWSHLQGAVSGLVCLLKPDVWNAVRSFWMCEKEMPSEAETEDSWLYNSGRSFLTRLSSMTASFRGGRGSIRASFRGELQGHWEGELSDGFEEENKSSGLVSVFGNGREHPSSRSVDVNPSTHESQHLAKIEESMPCDSTNDPEIGSSREVADVEDDIIRPSTLKIGTSQKRLQGEEISRDSSLPDGPIRRSASGVEKRVEPSEVAEHSTTPGEEDLHDLEQPDEWLGEDTPPKATERSGPAVAVGTPGDTTVQSLSDETPAT